MKPYKDYLKETKLSFDISSGDEADKILNAIDDKYRRKVKVTKKGGNISVDGPSSIIKKITSFIKDNPKVVIT